MLLEDMLRTVDVNSIEYINIRTHSTDSCIRAFNEITSSDIEKLINSHGYMMVTKWGFYNNLLDKKELRVWIA